MKHHCRTIFYIYIFFLSKYPSNNTNVGFETSLEHVFI